MRLLGKLCLAILLGMTCAATAQQASTLRYEFRPGDHIVYSEVLEKESTGEKSQTHSRVVFNSHVLVLAESDGVFSIGTQRNRESAGLVSYRENGKEALQQQLPKFTEAAAKIATRVAESNEFNSEGEALGVWQVRREWPSRLLFTVHEIEHFPKRPLKPGDRWRGTGMLGLNFTYVRDEEAGGELSALLEGTASGGKLRLRYWLGLKSHVARRITYIGEYLTPFGTVRENLNFELKEVRHSEGLEKWLADDETQLGALSALERSAWIEAPGEPVAALARGASGAARTAALGLLLRRGANLSGIGATGTAEEQRIVGRLGTTKLSSDPLNVPGATYRAMESAQHRGHPYIVHVPQDYVGDKAFPLLVYLSGGPGFAVEGLNSSVRMIDGSEFLVLYPNAIGMWWEKDSEKMFRELLDEVLSKYKVDPGRIYLAGFSNGGTGAEHFGSLWPDRFRGIVSLMGAGTCADPAVDPNKLAKSPVLLVHGDKDQVIPAQCSRDLFRSLQKKTKQVRLEIFPDRDHDITLDSDNGLTLEFIRKLDAAPGS